MANLTPEQRSKLSLVVQAGTAVDDGGNVVTSPKIGISTVPPELVRDMLPPGLLQHTFDITIQAPGVATFNTPLTMTFPNVFNAEPGTQLAFLSFDHTTGQLVIEGTATVSADGLSATTDPGQGITKPGWHGVTDWGCNRGGGSNGENGGDQSSEDPPPEVLPPEVHFLTGEDGEFPIIEFEAAEEPEGTSPPSPPGPCEVPERTASGSKMVTITIDGPLSSFLESTGSIDLERKKEKSFLFLDGSGRKKSRLAESQIHTRYGSAKTCRISTEINFGASVTIKTDEMKDDEIVSSTIRTIIIYRWASLVDSQAATDRTGNSAAFFRTSTDGVTRSKVIDTRLPKLIETTFMGGGAFSPASPIKNTATWTLIQKRPACTFKR